MRRYLTALTLCASFCRAADDPKPKPFEKLPKLELKRLPPASFTCAIPLKEIQAGTPQKFDPIGKPVVPLNIDPIAKPAPVPACQQR